MLKLENVDFYFGNLQVIHGVCLEMGEGITGLVGPVGAGKSTLFKLISGLLKPARGAIEFAGSELTQLRPHQIVQAGVVQVPERRRIFPEMTVKENLDLGAYARKDKDGIKEDLEYIYSVMPILRERENQLGMTLSGGEQQMLAIARAVMANPKLLLVDEPSLGLAPMVVELVMDLLAELNRTKKVQILLAEENMNVAIEASAELYLLRGGQVVLRGNTQEVKEEVRKHLEGTAAAEG